MAEVPVTNKKIQNIARNKTVILLFLQFLCASQCQYQNCTCRHFAEKFRKNIYRKYHVREPVSARKLNIIKTKAVTHDSCTDQIRKAITHFNKEFSASMT